MHQKGFCVFEFKRRSIYGTISQVDKTRGMDLLRHINISLGWIGQQHKLLY